MLDFEDLQTEKAKALAIYKLEKMDYLQNRSDENWLKFCEAKKNCMLLGCRI